MDKLLGLAADVGKAFLPVATDMAKAMLASGAKLAGRLGKVAVSTAKKKGSKRLLHKGRKILRITALVSGTVAVLSCAGLILSHKK